MSARHCYTRDDNEANDRPPGFGLQSVTHVVEDFERVFSESARGAKHLAVCADGLAGKLKSAKCRSIAWKMFFGLLPAGSTPEEWVGRIKELRGEYEVLLKKHKTDPNSMDDVDPLLNNPLSMDVESPWTKFYAEQELIETIGKDTNRLYPNGCGEFFEKMPTVTEGMTNVLFLWSQMHPDTSYRQGMHELLAPFFWLMESERLADDTVFNSQGVVDDGGSEKSSAGQDEEGESRDAVTGKGSSGEEGAPQETGLAIEMSKFESAVRALLDPKYIEHDAFWMFSKMMDDVEQLFFIHEVDSKALASAHRQAQRMGTATLSRRKRSETDAALEKVQEAREKATTPVDRTCNRIHHELLHVADPELHKRMVIMEVEPRLYALPWVRLMYCRCFHMDDVLTLWEGIFSATSDVALSSAGKGSALLVNMRAPVDREDRITEMIECVGVAMVMYVREYLMGAEAMFMLQRLMKYPPVEDVSVFVQRAVEIRANPGKRFAPDSAALAAEAAAQKRRELEAKAIAHQKAVASAAAANAFGQGSRLTGSVSDSGESGKGNLIGNMIGSVVGTGTRLVAGGGRTSSKPAFPRPGLSATKGNRRSQFEGQKPIRTAQDLDNAAAQQNRQRALMVRMGEQLGYISKVFETELCGKSPEDAAAAAVADKTAGGPGLPYDETIVLQALAQLKQVKDVLAGRIGESDCFWLYSIKEAADRAPVSGKDKE